MDPRTSRQGRRTSTTSLWRATSRITGTPRRSSKHPVTGVGHASACRIDRMTTPVDRSGSLIYDEDCGICVAAATWLETRVAASRLGLLAVGDVEDDPRITALVERKALSATLHFVRSDDTILTGARAVLAAGRVVPRWRLLAALSDNPIGQLLLEPVYRQIAAHREADRSRTRATNRLSPPKEATAVDLMPARSSVLGPAGGPSSGRESRIGPNPELRSPVGPAAGPVGGGERRFGPVPRVTFARWSGWRTGCWYEAGSGDPPSIDAERWATSDSIPTKKLGIDRAARTTPGPNGRSVPRLHPRALSAAP